MREAAGRVPTIVRTRQEIAAEVCARIAAGESVKGIFDRSPEPDYPSFRHWWRWVFADQNLRKTYEAATAFRAELRIEAGVDISLETPRIEETQFGSRIDPAWVALQKLKIATLQWDAARLAHKRYGDKLTIIGDPDNPVDIRHSVASRLFPDVAARGALGSLVEAEPAGSGGAELRVGVLGEAGTDGAAGQLDVLDASRGPGIRQDPNGLGTGAKVGED